ncbi:protein FAR1-RELATED SEQUENCE 5-like [Salvia miltiorrhiza]|uniref:protein FAR1-RELATED SEQUENCE 5-like n=1 Tax=Salvia miltiorrhiza TaxID=226208 RepID=UPI0025ACFA66|nr:protein FAR1-RELATED SEQUENCE 5-like [Salvia miltiorrhiza]
MIEEYDLTSNKWFSDIYEDRSMWIPAYFRDVHMSGLFRTTSMSESENSYFKRYINKHSNLVILYNNFCSALDAQRYKYKEVTHADETRSPVMMTNLKIEHNAAIVYTNSVFKEVQEQIDHANKGCAIRKMYTQGDEEIYVVEDNIDGEFTVRYVRPQHDVLCSCTLFTRKGTPCMHMFVVFRNLKLDAIPDKYIVRRWCKFSILCPNESLGVVREDGSKSTPNFEFLIFKVVSEMIGRVRGNQEMCDQLYDNLIQVRDKYAEIGTYVNPSTAKSRLFEEFYGSTPAESPSVLPPDIAKTKGSGAGGRRKSEKEKAIIIAQKPLHLCRRCNKKVHHDSRNCPRKDDPKVIS